MTVRVNEISVMDDRRLIESVWVDEHSGATVGRDGVTRIECYREAGQGGYVPWFAVYRDDFLAVRFSGHSAIVQYKGPESDAF